MGWGHDYTLIRFKKDHDDEWDATYMSVKDFYAESEKQIAEYKTIISSNSVFDEDISSLITEFTLPMEYNGIYVLKEIEWRSDILRTVTGLTYCFMFPDYTFQMLLTLKGSIDQLKDKLYYTAIKGKWELRGDQENFREFRDPAQDYIDSMGTQYLYLYI